MRLIHRDLSYSIVMYIVNVIQKLVVVLHEISWFAALPTESSVPLTTSAVFL